MGPKREREKININKNLSEQTSLFWSVHLLLASPLYCVQTNTDSFCFFFVFFFFLFSFLEAYAKPSKTHSQIFNELSLSQSSSHFFFASLVFVTTNFALYFMPFFFKNLNVLEIFFGFLVHFKNVETKKGELHQRYAQTGDKKPHVEVRKKKETPHHCHLEPNKKILESFKVYLFIYSFIHLAYSWWIQINLKKKKTKCGSKFSYYVMHVNVGGAIIANYFIFSNY